MIIIINTYRWRSMRIAYTREQEEFRAEIRAYFGKLITSEVRSAFDNYEDAEDSAYREVVRRIGEDGWLTLSWPEEYGGRGLSPIESYIFFEETQQLGVPMPWLTLNTVGPTLMQFGTEEQKAQFLPAIARGDVHFSIGYSEPQAGSDLASLRTRAVRDGAQWVINGQKMWTSLIHHADYVWLAARTDPAAPKHAGISIIIVPTDTPGFSWTPVHTLRGGFTSAGYYEDVRVPVTNLVGEENQGWRLITSQLNAERVTISPVGVLTRKLDAVRDWAVATTDEDGRALLQREWVQVHLARVYAKVQFLQLMNWKLASGHDAPSAAEASAMKVFGTEFYVEAFRLRREVLDADSLLHADAPGQELRESLESAMRWAVLMTFGGGTNEVQREIIARVGLGLPRMPR
jgi:alkylation response protein AidB-like acyl-CoA dehydrogenase